jgi:HD-GYP domain-containing protein (c-di-GMP phosphodiesterase class II)
MLRYFPKLKFNDVETGLLGVGVKYNISQFIPLSPVDIAVQVLYNNLTFDYVGDVKENFFNSESKNFAINAHASKTFSGMFTLYGGVQYESTTFDVEYYFRDPSGLYPQLADKNEKIQPIREVHDEKLNEIKELYHTAQRYKRIDIRGVDDIIKAFVQGFTHGINPLGLMASLKSSDEYTFTHVVNVCILTMAQSEALGFEGNYLYKIGVASLLHDVGKLFIPEEIINKPGKLTDEERSVIETHTIKGARYLLRIVNIPKLAVLGAIEHHIKFDGTGYPSFGSGWKTNIVSQMIAISDVFDALRSRRVYSEPKPEDLIFKILKEEKGKTFNPFLVNNFFKIIGEKENDGSSE